MKRRILAWLLILCLVFAFVACTKDGDADAGNNGGETPSDSTGNTGENGNNGDNGNGGENGENGENGAVGDPNKDPVVPDIPWD